MTLRRPARIAVIAEKYGMAGGSERFVREVTERLAATGRWEFHVFTNRWQGGVAGVTFHRVPRIKFPRFLRPLLFTMLAQRRIARGGFDLVHAHWPTFRADVFSTHGAPHSHWVGHVLRRRPNLFDRVSMMIDRRMIAQGNESVFMPVSGFLRERFEEAFGALPGLWKVVHPGVDAQRFARDPAARVAVRSALGIEADDRVLLFVGMNFVPKGLGALLEGFADLRRRQHSLPSRLVAVGRGPVAPFRRRARELGVADRVHFVEPQSSGVERFYSAADAFALTSEFETFGMVVLEAMAAGLPVLISDRMGVRDLVQDGVEGFVVRRQADPGLLGERLAMLLDPVRGASMGAAARETAKGHTWQCVADEVERVYEARLAARPGGSR